MMTYECPNCARHYFDALDADRCPCEADEIDAGFWKPEEIASMDAAYDRGEVGAWSKDLGPTGYEEFPEGQFRDLDPAYDERDLF